MPSYYYPFSSIIFHGSNVEASTFLVKTNDEKELRKELLEWKRGLDFLKSHNIIAFYFKENEMITTNGKIFREIFNTEPFSMQFHKDWSKDVGLVHLNFTTSALVKITTKSMLYYRIKVFVVFTYYNNVNLTEFIFYFNRMIRNAWSDVRIQSKFFSKAIVLIMSNVGQVVTLNLKNGKCIQERIKSVNANKRTVLLERPFLNGKPMGEREKIFQINSIHSFRILNTEAETPNKKAISEKTIESTTTHDDAVAACAARDCPLKTTKHEETIKVKTWPWNSYFKWKKLFLQLMVNRSHYQLWLYQSTKGDERFFEIMMWHSWIIIIALINHTLFITACKKTFGSCAWPIGQRAKLPSEGL
ncbi:Alanine--tRNA ligase [Dirofilaria immitis]